MNTQPRIRPKAVLKAVLGVLCLAAVGFLILLRIAIELQRPTRREATAFLNSEFDAQKLRAWANEQFEIGKTNTVQELEAPIAVRKNPHPKHNAPLGFTYSAGSSERDAELRNDETFINRDEFKEVRIYPTNSTVNHSDKTTFLITNHIYVRINRGTGESR